MRWLVLLAVLVVGGCETPVGPSSAELKAGWDAQNVFPQNYKADLMAFLRTYLNDPTGVRSASVAQPTLKDRGPGQRYIVCLRYNARDNTGAYTGMKTGAAVYVSAKLDDFGYQPKQVKELCKDAVYAPYLERPCAELRSMRASAGVALGQLAYAAVPGLSREMVERLEAARPATLADAGRVRGVTPAALAAILVSSRRSADAA